MDFIFGTPLWKLNSDSFDEKKITEEIFNAQRSDPEGLSVSNVGGYHSGYDFDTPLTNEYIRSRLEGTGGLDFPHRVIERWFNISYKGYMMKPHTHGSIGLSGVLFITDAPRLILSNPAQSVVDIPKFNEVHIINGKPGEIVIFPSNILHWVDPSKVETPRITYAFNIELNI